MGNIMSHRRKKSRRSTAPPPPQPPSKPEVTKADIEKLLKPRKLYVDAYHYAGFDEVMMIVDADAVDTFLEVAQEQLQSVSFKDKRYMLKFKCGEIRTEYFLLDLWTKIAPFIREAKFGSADKPLINVLPIAKGLKTVEILDNIGKDAFQDLFKTPVKNLRAPSFVIAFINGHAKTMDIKLEHVEIVTRWSILSILASVAEGNSPSTFIKVFQQLLSNFRINCKSLKLEWDGPVEELNDVFLPIQNKIISDTVEDFQICCYMDEHYWNSVPSLKALLEALQKMFPNLKHLKVVMEGRSFFGTNSIDNFAQPIKMLKSRLQEANIRYRLDVEQKIHSLFKASKNESVMKDLTQNGFVTAENHKSCVYEEKIDAGKNLKFVHNIVSEIPFL